MVAHTRADSAPKPTDPALAGARILVVEARYYDAIADELLSGALAAIEAARARVAEMNKGGGAAEAALGVLALKRAAEAARPR